MSKIFLCEEGSSHIPCRCLKCGWFGSSDQLHGQKKEIGDYKCPMCGGEGLSGDQPNEIDLSELYVCYEWSLIMEVISKKGRRWKGHNVLMLGCTYKEARESVMVDLAKKKHTFVKMKSARARRIAFAFKRNDSGLNMPSAVYNKINLPVISDL